MPSRSIVVELEVAISLSDAAHYLLQTKLLRFWGFVNFFFFKQIRMTTIMREMVSKLGRSEGEEPFILPCGILFVSCCCSAFVAGSLTSSS